VARNIASARGALCPLHVDRPGPAASSAPAIPAQRGTCRARPSRTKIGLGPQSFRNSLRAVASTERSCGACGRGLRSRPSLHGVRAGSYESLRVEGFDPRCRSGSRTRIRAVGDDVTQRASVGRFRPRPCRLDRRQHVLPQGLSTSAATAACMFADGERRLGNTTDNSS